MKIGYARVSTYDQDNSLQISELKKFGCQKIFEEKASGKNINRPELKKMFEHLREGDIVVVYKLDRISRSLKDMMKILETIESSGAHFQCTTTPIDTHSAAGRMFIQMLSAFAEYEREIITERTRAGLEEYRKKGKKLGRPYKLSLEQREEIRNLVNQGRPYLYIGRLFNITPTTVFRVAKEV